MLFDVIIIIRKKKNECAAAEAPTITGQGSRTMVVLVPAPKRRRVEGEEGIEEGEESDEEQGELVAVKKGKLSLLKEVFEQVKSTFEGWRWDVRGP